MTTMQLLTTKQVSDHLGVSVVTVNRWVREGRLKPVAEGDGIRGARWFDRDEVEELAKRIAEAS